MSLCCKYGGRENYEINPGKSQNGAILRILNGPGTKWRLFEKSSFVDPKSRFVDPKSSFVDPKSSFLDPKSSLDV
jgi:hypothetical protein